MTKLLITIDDIARLSSFDGNIDNDSINPFIFMAQDSEIQRILGVELYDKILLDFENDDLAGDYLTLYTKYISIALAYFSCSFYYDLGLPKVSQNGAYYSTPEKTERLTTEDASDKADKYSKLAVKKELDMIEFLDKANLPERPAPSSIKAKSNFNWMRP